MRYGAFSIFLLLVCFGAGLLAEAAIPTPPLVAALAALVVFGAHRFIASHPQANGAAIKAYTASSLLGVLVGVLLLA
jgi:TM2 domain-containing membrane protein YozV